MQDREDGEGEVITRSVMRYPGGKYRLAAWVISHFPAHETYVELFGGAASVLMKKTRSIGEVYNDLNGDVVNVFRILRDREQAAELARLLALTPYANEEYRLAYENCDDPIERARRMIFRSFAGHGSDSVFRAHAGFRGYKNKQSGVTTANEWSNFPKEIPVFVERLRVVCIEQREAIKIISIYDRPDTLFYADPPYLISTKSARSVKYFCEMTEEEHVELAVILHKIQGMAIVSGYPSELYDRIYSDWRCVRKSHRAQNAKKTTECLWLSPNIKTTLF
jgi:DNA adenine methylase